MDSKAQDLERLPARSRPGFQTARDYLNRAASAFSEIADDLDQLVREGKERDEPEGERFVRLSDTFAAVLAAKLRQCGELSLAAAAPCSLRFGGGATEIGGFPRDVLGATDAPAAPAAKPGAASAKPVRPAPAP